MASTRQTLLRFSLPEGMKLYPRQFRELLAARGTFSSQFFHRDAVTGRPANGRAMISMIGGPRWVGVLAQPGAEHLIDAHMVECLRAITAHVAAPVPMQIEQYDISLAATPYPVQYRLSEICLRKRIKQPKMLRHQRLQHGRDKPNEQEIREVILRGLSAAARKHGWDLPLDEQIDLNIWIKKEMGLRIETSEGLGDGACLIIADVSMHLDLGGIWQFGDLSSRGYGRLIRQNPGVPRNARIELGEGVVK